MKKILTATAALVVSGLAFANTDIDASLQEAFDALDSAGDGFITWVEAESNPELFDQFAELDLNGDNVLTIDEFEAFFKENMAMDQ
ncbi:MAG: EF-hand domain-containing protein [Saccharospirillum sp.]|nr:EF-hand domain-containing protein [Saccharospirillum sp.]